MSLSTLRNGQDLERGILAGFYRAFTQAEVDGAPKQPFTVTRDGVRQPFEVARDNGKRIEWSVSITLVQFKAAMGPCGFRGEVIYTQFGLCLYDVAKISWESLMGTEKWSDVSYRTEENFPEAWTCFMVITYRCDNQMDVQTRAMHQRVIKVPADIEPFTVLARAKQLF